MSQEFTTLQTTLPAIINELRCQEFATPAPRRDCGNADQVCFNGGCIEDPNLGAGCVPDMWTGVGH